MKSICDLLKRKPSIENSGDNYGVEAAANSGLIVVNQGMGYDNTKASLSQGFLLVFYPLILTNLASDSQQPFDTNDISHKKPIMLFPY